MIFNGFTSESVVATVAPRTLIARSNNSVAGASSSPLKAKGSVPSIYYRSSFRWPGYRVCFPAGDSGCQIINTRDRPFRPLRPARRARRPHRRHPFACRDGNLRTALERSADALRTHRAHRTARNILRSRGQSGRALKLTRLDSATVVPKSRNVACPYFQFRREAKIAPTINATIPAIYCHKGKFRFAFGFVFGSLSTAGMGLALGFEGDAAGLYIVLAD